MNPLALLAAIRAHAAGGAGAPGPGAPGPIPAPGPQGPQGGGGGNFTQLVQQMIDLGVQALRAAPDAVDAQGMSKILSSLHTFAAQEQQDKDAAMGVSPAVRAVRRQTAAAQG